MLVLHVPLDYRAERLRGKTGLAELLEPGHLRTTVRRENDEAASLQELKTAHRVGSCMDIECTSS